MDERETLFVSEYIANKGNAYQAALKAGYAKATAKHAYQWLEETQSNPTRKRHLPFKPHLKKAIDDKLAEINSAKTADAQEVMEYLTSVMRKEARSEVIVVEGTGEGRSSARLVEKPPDEKEATKAAEILSKILGMSNSVSIDISVPVFEGEDSLED